MTLSSQNPPFGSKGANQTPDRDDFVVSTANKQLNFLQHVMTLLKPGGRAAVVVPDSVLFADQAADIFRVLTEDCNLHTVLRCPRGTFSPYSAGTKTYVLFFTKGVRTTATWIYDCRAGIPKITKRSRPLTPSYFTEFEKCYGSDPNGTSERKEDQSPDGRWRKFDMGEMRAVSFKLDRFKWLPDEAAYEDEDAAEPEEVLTDVLTSLIAAVDDLKILQESLESDVSSDGTVTDDLPEGWALALLPQVAEITMGQSPPGSSYNEAGEGLPFFQGKAEFGKDHPTVRKWCTQPSRIAEPGDILMSVRAPVGPTNVADQKCAFGRGLAGIRPRPGVNADLLRYALALQERHLASLGAGTTFTAINKTELHEIEIPIPPPAEQARLAAALREMLDHIEVAGERLVTAISAGYGKPEITAGNLTDRLRNSVLNRAFSGGLVDLEADVASREDRTYETAADFLARLKNARSQVPRGIVPPRRRQRRTR